MAGQPYMSRPFGDLESVQGVLAAGAGNGHECYLASVGRIVRWHRPSFNDAACQRRSAQGCISFALR
jgi:hypothetical protein